LGRSFASGEEDADVAGANVVIGRMVVLMVLASARCVHWSISRALRGAIRDGFGALLHALWSYN
jgi:hypothetical protein